MDRHRSQMKLRRAAAGALTAVLVAAGGMPAAAVADEHQVFHESSDTLGVSQQSRAHWFTLNGIQGYSGSGENRSPTGCYYDLAYDVSYWAGRKTPTLARISAYEKAVLAGVNKENRAGQPAVRKVGTTRVSSTRYGQTDFDGVSFRVTDEARDCRASVRSRALGAGHWLYDHGAQIAGLAAGIGASLALESIVTAAAPELLGSGALQAVIGCLSGAVAGFVESAIRYGSTEGYKDEFEVAVGVVWTSIKGCVYGAALGVATTKVFSAISRWWASEAAQNLAAVDEVLADIANDQALGPLGAAPGIRPIDGPPVWQLQEMRLRLPFAQRAAKELSPLPKDQLNPRFRILSRNAAAAAALTWRPPLAMRSPR